MSGARGSVFQSPPLILSYLVLQIKFKISILLAIIIEKKKITFIQMLSDDMGMSLSDLSAVPDPSPHKPRLQNKVIDQYRAMKPCSPHPE